MSQEIDLSGEQEPTEIMTDRDEQLSEEQPENHRQTEFEGEDRTEDFDLSEALSNL